MGAIDQLMEMGFPKEKAERALSHCGNNAEQAMEWLLAHVDDDAPSDPAPATLTLDPVGNATTAPKSDESSTEVSAEGGSGAEAPAMEAKSIKCEDCGRLFKTSLEVEFHATKSGHANFSESTEEKKPLTEEEKKAQLKLIEEKIAKKRAEREEREKQDALEKERMRIKSGKDMTEIRKKMEDDEMKKIMDERKREKAEEKAARDRVRAQIESDKEARRLRAGQSPAAPAQVVPQASTASSSVTSPPKDYKQTRVQIRLPNGTALTETFDKNEQLAAVRLFVQLKQGDEAGVTTFGMMTTFPRKVFGEEDYEMTLEQLGLVPSATIMVTKVSS